MEEHTCNVSGGRGLPLQTADRNKIRKIMRPLIAGNWKMHGLSSQLAEIEAIAASVKLRPTHADVLVCLPATLIARASSLAAGRIAIGAQNCHSEISGAFTGDISAEMLRDAGANTVILGHSERRQHHGETDAVVAKKVEAASRAGLLAIICIGETQLQRKDGKALAVCGNQIAASLPDSMSMSVNAVGYEPLWAIGSGQEPTPDEIVEMHEHIRECLVSRLGTRGRAIRILFGGSVNPDNARAILALPEVDGALVGGASLKATDFAAIIGVVPAEP